MANLAGPTDERRAIELLKNHAEFKATLVHLSMSGDLPILQSHVHAAAGKWFELAKLHFADASAHPRAVEQYLKTGDMRGVDWRQFVG